MLNYIAMYPNPYADEFNNSFILGTDDAPLEDYVITAMKEFEAIENIRIEDIKRVKDDDEVDIHLHNININYKKKDLDKVIAEAPKFKYTTQSRYSELIFKIRITTNLNEKVIEKHILVPKQDPTTGAYLNNDKTMRALWQLVDASTYSQRGKITLKSRMPVIIYHNKNRIFQDVDGNEVVMPSYSYAMDAKKKRGPGGADKKGITKFLNPLMIYMAKMGFKNTRDFFGMKDIVMIVPEYDEDDKENYYIFPLDEVFVRVNKRLFNKYEMVRAFTCMCCNLRSKDFPVDMDKLEDHEYWVCRIGYVGSIKNKNILSFKDKGENTILMIERLLDQVTINNLRLPMYYKVNIYYLLYWMITNFHDLKKRSNMDMENKRIRRNEYIVIASLGRKINDNINKFVERQSKSRMNTMDTLLELFNFNSDIIMSAMRNLGDLIKTDDIANDMNFLMDLAYSSKGPSAMADGSSKLVAAKYRFLDPSDAGRRDLNVSSNSDVGMSGSFTPYVKTYNGFYFTPNPEPCTARYEWDKAMKEEENWPIEVDVSSFDNYIASMEHMDKFRDLLQYEKLMIVEKE